MQMESNIILIPSTPTDCPLGNVFSNFFIISSTTERMEGENVVWDFCNVRSMHPFLLFSLALLKQTSRKAISCINRRKDIELLLADVCFEQAMRITSHPEALALQRHSSKHYLPICLFPAKEDAVQRVLQDIILQQSKAEGMATPLAYVSGEIICNVAQHSGSETVYFHSFFDEQSNTINICIADTGIGIYSSYVKANKYVEKISDNEAEALRLANEGFSTKNLPEAENRGFGISTSRNMVVKGLGGTFSVLSGNALQLSSAGHENLFLQLPQEVEWQGTMVFMQLPGKARRGFRYVDYLE